MQEKPRRQENTKTVKSCNYAARIKPRICVLISASALAIRKAVVIISRAILRRRGQNERQETRFFCLARFRLLGIIICFSMK